MRATRRGRALGYVAFFAVLTLWLGACLTIGAR